MHRQVEWHCSAWPLRTPRRRAHRRGRRHQRTARQRTNSSPSPTFPRKFPDVDWGSRKINPNKICAECWPGAAFGPYWLLTERLRYETTPLLPALRDRVHVHGQRDVAYASHRRSHAASGDRRAALDKSLTPIAKSTFALASLLSSSLNLSASSSIFRRKIL